ncbi:IS5 family transposase [Nocardia acididurans]|uniref:IS5 family transposase n=1 Tax=Nocardia acididurans TaxID=2802282 RepID=UPI001E39F8A6|nr:IS5 family transposase [Nocardia acididurans]
MSFYSANIITGIPIAEISCACVACRFGHGTDRPPRKRRYTCDATDAEWAVLAPLLPWPSWLDGGGGHPEKYCRRTVIDAICYVVDNGIKWRNLPSDYEIPWRTVHAILTRWNRAGFTLAVHNDLRERVRMIEGRAAEPTVAVIDSQSVRAAETVGSASRGWDAGKKVAGRKRHVLVDSIGLLLVVVVTAASVQDRDGARTALTLLREWFEKISLIWADGAYAGKLVTWARHTLGYTIEIVKRSDDATGFEVIPRRWVVERTLAWIFQHRRCVRDYERLPEHHEAMVQWAMIILMRRRLARTR